MAGPRSVFVSGPSVNPSIGSPQGFLRGIQQSIDARIANKRAKEAQAQQKIFQDAASKRQQQQLDFNLAAPERAEQLRVDTLARDVDKTQTIQNYAKGAQFSGGDRFTGLEDELMKDPRYAKLDDAGKLAARNEYILNNPTALTDPKTFANTLRSGLTASGKFTGAEIDAAVAAQVAQRWPTADPDLVKAQLLKPKDFVTSSGNQLNLSVNGQGQVSRGGGSFSPIADPTNPTERGTVVDRISDTFGLSKSPTTLPLLGTRVDIGNLDATKQDVAQGVGFLAANGANSPTAQEAAFNMAFNDDGTVKEAFNWKTAKGREKLLSEAQKAQATEERLLNKKTGGVQSPAGQSAAGGVSSLSDAATAAANFNQPLLSSLTPRNLSDAQVLESFLNRLGPAEAAAPDTTRQGVGSTGGSAPAVTPDAVSTPPPAAADTLPPLDIEQAVADAPQLRSLQDVADTGISPLSVLQQGASTLADSIFGGQPAPAEAPSEEEVAKIATPKKDESPDDLRSLTGADRSNALDAAKALLRRGVISYDDAPAGGTLNDKLLIAYRRHLNKNK